ncbi:hypothetical protein ABW21_db0205373 [Orbilia brochopaga]|nr:hypothetical protein ABW21_db0205373 [Drechslerella brochopaga]
MTGAHHTESWRSRYHAEVYHSNPNSLILRNPRCPGSPQCINCNAREEGSGGHHRPLLKEGTIDIHSVPPSQSPVHHRPQLGRDILNTLAGTKSRSRKTLAVWRHGLQKEENRAGLLMSRVRQARGCSSAKACSSHTLPIDKPDVGDIDTEMLMYSYTTGR